MSYRGYSQRGRRGGSYKRSRNDGDFHGYRDGPRENSGRGNPRGKSRATQPESIARSPERAPVVASIEKAGLNYIEWPDENLSGPPPVSLSDPSMPKDLAGVIGYCSDKSIKELPSKLVTPSEIHQSVQDAKKYLFGSDLETAMRASLEEYNKVSFIKFY